MSLHREVAIKVIRPDHAFFAESRQRFLREASAIARLQHPGIVPVHTAGEDGGVLYYAMDLVAGCTLAQVLAALVGREPAGLHGSDLAAAVAQCAPPAAHEDATPAPWRGSWVECCLRVVRDVAAALEHAHERGVLHRDVKPSNVMLARDGRVMLLDFGLASTDSDARITRSGAQIGSLAYMAPEQVRGDAHAVAPATDVYAAGVLLYEMLTLTQPFLAESSEATRQAVLAAAPPSLRARNRAVATDAELVCRKALDPDPARRYARARDLAHDLTNVLELRPIEARAPSPWLRLRRAAQRHPVRALSLGFAAVLLLGVFPVLYLQQRAARLRLQEEQGRTAAALVAANAARARAEAEEERARWGLGKAREAVDRFLADIGEFRAVDIPLLEQLRKDTLQQAATLYEQLLADPESARDGTLSLEHARTLFSLSQVLRELDRWAEAEPVLQRVVARLLAEPAPSRDTRWLLVSARSALGSVCLQLDRLEQADVALTQSGAELAELARVAAGGKEGAQDPVQIALLRNRVTLANLRREQRRAEEATQLYGEAIAAGGMLARDLEVLRLLADAHRGLALLLARQSTTAAALDEHENVVALRRQIVARAPSSARLRSELASALRDLGGHLQAWLPKRKADALMVLDEAAALLTDLVRDFPQQTRFKIDLSRARIVTATLRQDLELPGDAKNDLHQAIAMLASVRSELPHERVWRAPLGFARHALATQLQREGDDAAADAEFTRAHDLLAQWRQESPHDKEMLQQEVELLLARSTSRALNPEAALALAREAFDRGRVLLEQHMQDARLYGSAFRAFEHLARVLCERGDVAASLQVADTYRAAQPYKWLCQLTLARTYLRCRELLASQTDAGDAEAKALRQRCYDDALRAVQQAAQHNLRAVLRIEQDAVFAPLLQDSAIAELLRQARAGKG
jgi:hypothetical protein